MTIEWTRTPVESGYHFWVRNGEPISQGSFIFIPINLRLPQTEEQQVQRGRDWYLGPITGYPTEHIGTINA